MHPYLNEDVAFERLKDLQREMENSRMAADSLVGLGKLVRNLAARAWLLAGLAMRRAPRRRPGLSRSITRRPPRRMWLRSRASGRQALQHRDLLGVGTAPGAGHLQDEREPREARLVQEGAKPFFTDLTGSDVRVPVAVGAEAGHRVVAVDDLDVREADHAVQRVERLRHLARRSLVVARGEGMARVEADRHAWIIQRGKHLGDLFKTCADAAAEPGIVLDQQARRGRIRPFEHVLQVLHDGGKPGLEAGALMRPGVKDDAVHAEVVGGLEVGGERAF